VERNEALLRCYLNWNLRFARWRVLAWRGESVELWTRWSGLPSKVLLTVPAHEVELLHPGRGYDRIGVGRKRVWVPSKLTTAIGLRRKHPDVPPRVKRAPAEVRSHSVATSGRHGSPHPETCRVEG
jgi:hypothetical protein